MDQSEDFPIDMLDFNWQDVFSEDLYFADTGILDAEYRGLLLDPPGLRNLDSSEPPQFLDSSTEVESMLLAQSTLDFQTSDIGSDLFTWLAALDQMEWSHSESLFAPEAEAPMSDATVFDTAASSSSSGLIPQINNATLASQGPAIDSSLLLSTPQHDSIRSQPRCRHILPKSPAATQVIRARRKRSRSPEAQPEGIPSSFYNVFEITAVEDDTSQSMVNTKRIKVAKACLRCQAQKIRVRCNYGSWRVPS